MAEKNTVTGMVLKTMPMGEYNKRITLLTKEYGKIAAFAKGARRPGNQLMAATEPFAFGQFELFEGRSSYTVSKAEITQYFRDLSTEPILACVGFYFLELADYFSQENVEAREQLLLLYQSLKALERPQFHPRLVRCIYELKTLFISGEYPNVFRCVKCGTKENLQGYHISLGGVLCKDCMTRYGGERIDQSVLYTMQFVFSTPIAKLFSFRVNDKVLESLENILAKYMDHYVNHKFQSLKILKDMLY